MRLLRLAVAVLLSSLALAAAAQQPDETIYSRLNTFSGFFEYSNDSSHIILGAAENRKIGAIGFQYQRRLVNRRLWNFSFAVEARPGMLESDPTQIATNYQTVPTTETFQEGQPTPVTRCITSTTSFSGTVVTTIGPQPYAYQIVDTCGRRTVIEQGFSPAGIRFNLMPRHRLQLTFSSLAGYMFSTQEVPILGAGSFNYTFEFGGGFEYFRSRNRSIRLEYQVQHFSNKKTADLNPGVDSGFVKLTYAFGH
jgi:opacity protein-like surface antigen